MKNLSILAACALMSAPLCMPAYAELNTIQEYADACIQMLNDAADILEKVTPDTADASIEKLMELKPRMLAIIDSESQFSDEERQHAFEGEKWEAVNKRMREAVARLSLEIQSAAPEARAKLEKVWNTCAVLCR
ncbi:MAG: hypothetical protein J1E42_05875 [Akkermansiaceae bacterium]|nr:hypothetical protein [Akkermansiaceae bacterium]